MAKGVLNRGRTHKRGPALRYADLPRSTRRKMDRLLDLELAEKQGKAGPPSAGQMVFRFRFQLVPVAWLAAASAGVACHQGHAYLVAAVGAVVMVVATVAGARALRPFARKYNQGMAAWCAAWLMVLAWLGPGWWAVIGLAGWALPSGVWAHRYRWTPAAPQPEPDLTVEDTWAELCAENKWHAGLAAPVPIPGGRQWEIVCVGAKTHIGKITARRDEVAAAFDKSIVEAYTEPARSGKRSRGTLTILSRGTLETPRRWGGHGVDPATGLAVVGRFPEGGDLHERWFVPGIGGGAKHTIIAGADGTGKTALINLGLAISAASGNIAPVILDPQEGQALPAWKPYVPYACGAEECMGWLRGLHAGMFDRSRFLASLEWAHPESGTVVRGMDFFDYRIAAAACAKLGLPPLPFIEVTIDEAPVLLAMKGAPELLLDIAKLGRKAGFRLRLAAQVPSISELAKGELRSILTAGSVFCFRTGDRLTAGMAGIPSNPNELPDTWSDGVTPTFGLGFAKTVDNRPTVTSRTDWVPNPYEAAARARFPAVEEGIASRLASSVAADAAELNRQAGEQAQVTRAEAKVLGMLARPMQLHKLAAQSGLAVSEAVDAVRSLEAAGKVRRTGEGLVAKADER